MNFLQLQENLRRALWRRIEAGRVSGLKLAQQTGFQQAHISNFLNRKRGLSLEGMDKVLASQGLSIFDLLDPAEINKRASIPPPPAEGFENVLLVDAETAATDARVTSEKVRDIIKFKASFLKKLKPQMETPRASWTRFVAIRLGQEAMSMYPRLAPHALVLIDRHYNSLRPVRKGAPSLYAVRQHSQCIVRYVELAGDNLVLRPHQQAYPVHVIAVEEGKSYADHLVGRICYVGMEI
jgi:hypothetical protein